MKAIHLLLYFVFLLAGGKASGQSENNKWCFGDHHGLDFNTAGNPVHFSSGIYTTEACGTLCNSAGALLFYSDALSVYNKDHLIMPNGSGISGAQTANQGVAIAEVQDLPNNYYLFTLNTENTFFSPASLSYSIIDMSLNGGLGDVTIKNQLLADSLSEKMIVIGNCSNQWLITHHLDSGIFYAFNLNGGINPVPVKSYVGDYRSHSSYKYGDMIASPDFKHLALANVRGNSSITNTMEIYDFDENTGIVSNRKLIDTSDFPIECVEFSADGSRLYITGYYPKGIHQYDLSLASVADITASRFMVHHGIFAGLRRGPDSMIYIMPYTHATNLSRIKKPHLLGGACTFEADFLSPGFTSTIFSAGFGTHFIKSKKELTEVKTTKTEICQGTTVHIKKEGFKTYLWSDADTSSSKTLSSTGVYWLRSQNTCSTYIDTFYLTVIPTDTLFASWDTGLCAGDSIVLSAENTYHSFLWTGGYTGKDTTLYKEAKLLLTASDSVNCKVLRKEFDVSFIQFLDHPNTVQKCEGDTIVLAAPLNHPDAQYKWSTGASTPTIKVSTAGTKIVTATASGCMISDTIVVKETVIDTSIDGISTKCEGEILTLKALEANASYYWSTGQSTQSVELSEQGKYSLRLNKGNCQAIREFDISFKQCEHCVVMPTAFTPNNDGRNDYFNPLLYCSSITGYQLRIVNRWGQEVFSSNNFNDKWDGTQQGVPAAAGVYFYFLKIKFGFNKDEELLKGDLTLLR